MAKTETEFQYFDSFTHACQWLQEQILVKTIVKAQITAIGGWEVKIWVRTK